MGSRRRRRFSSAANKSLELQDKDPYDYARAIRVFPESKRASLHFKVHTAQNQNGRLEIEVTDRFGYRPVRLIFAEDGDLRSSTVPKSPASCLTKRTNGTTWA